MKKTRLLLAAAAAVVAGGWWFSRSDGPPRPQPRAHSLVTVEPGVAASERDATGSPDVPDRTNGTAGVRPIPRPPDPARRFIDFSPEQRVEFARRGHGPGG